MVNHTISAWWCHLNTTLIHTHVRMVIQFLCTIVLTAPSYFTSYHSTYLHHFAMKMWECRSVLRWSPMRKVKFWKKQHYWSRRSWPAPKVPINSCVLFEVCFLASVYVPECDFFNSLGVVFHILGLPDGATTLKKWLYHLSSPTPHLDILNTNLTGPFG